MKNKRLSAKKQEHKILGGQAQKLKDKLQGLKEQIKMKKQQKQMNKTFNSINSTKTNTRTSQRLQLNATQSSFTSKPSLHDLLSQIKIQNIEARLKEKNITTIEQFYSTQLSQIDGWKDVPVGYRIKIKKHIQSHRDKEIKPEERNQIQSGVKKEEVSDIQSIIESRKQQNKFVAIQRVKDIESEGEHVDQLEEQEQEKMMLSIMLAFRGRTSSFKGKKSKKVAKHVHWSPEVQEHDQLHCSTKTYPKQIISKSLFDVKNSPIEQVELEKQQQKAPSSFKPKVNTFVEQKEFPNYKYCWTCLKKIQSNTIEQAGKHFCNKKCNSAYKQTVDQSLLAEADHFQEAIQKEAEPIQEEAFEIDFDIV